MAYASSKEFLDIQASIECRFTLKLVRDMIIIYSQMHGTDKYSKQSSIISPVWLNAWVFVYELIRCGCESRCCHLNYCQRRDTLNNYNQIIITKDDKNNDMTSNNNNGNGNNNLDVIKNRKMLYWSYVEDVTRIIKT